MYNNIDEIRLDFILNNITCLADAEDFIIDVSTDMLEEYLDKDNPLILTPLGEIIRYSALSRNTNAYVDLTTLYDTVLSSIVSDALEGLEVNVFRGNELVVTGVLRLRLDGAPSIVGYDEPDHVVAVDSNYIFKYMGTNQVVDINKDILEQSLLLDVYILDDQNESLSLYLEGFEPKLFIDYPCYIVFVENTLMAFEESTTELTVVETKKTASDAIRFVREITHSDMFDYSADLFVRAEGELYPIGNISSSKNLTKATPNSKQRTVWRWSHVITLDQTEYTDSVSDTITGYGRKTIVEFINQHSKVVII